MTLPRLYGRKNFTEKKSVQAILAGHEDAPSKGGVVPLRLAPDSALALLNQLPTEQMDDRVSDAAPTMAEMVRFASEIPGSTILGLRVPPPQEDERISFYGFTLPQPSVDMPTMKKIVDRGADARVKWVRKGQEVSLEVTW